jgi:predicted HicB family RNase H-like nuclease
MPDDNQFSESFSTGINTPADDAAEEATQAATGEDEAEESQLNVRIPKPLHEAFRRKCDAEARNMSALVRRWVREYVRKDE